MSLNKQATFDFVAEKLLKQGKACTNGPWCAYGDGKGNHCAVGWLLPEDDKELMEFTGNIYGLLQHFPDLRERLGIDSEQDEQFLRNLQRAHDDTGPCMPREGDMKGSLRHFAVMYGLDESILDRAITE